MTNFMQYNLISHFLSLQPMFSFRSTIFLITNDTDFHYLSWQLFFVFRKFHMFRALGHLSNVIHSSSNCVFFLPSHKTFEVKFPLWLKDKVEFLACLNMLIQWVLRWSAYYFWNSGEKTIQTYKYYLPFLTF